MKGGRTSTWDSGLTPSPRAHYHPTSRPRWLQIVVLVVDTRSLTSLHSRVPGWADLDQREAVEGTFRFGTLPAAAGCIHSLAATVCWSAHLHDGFCAGVLRIARESGHEYLYCGLESVYAPDGFLAPVVRDPNPVAGCGTARLLLWRGYEVDGDGGCLWSAMQDIYNRCSMRLALLPLLFLFLFLSPSASWRVCMSRGACHGLTPRRSIEQVVRLCTVRAREETPVRWWCTRDCCCRGTQCRATRGPCLRQVHGRQGGLVQFSSAAAVPAGCTSSQGDQGAAGVDR